MVDIDWAKYRALTALLKESTLELDEFHNLLRSELSQLIADVKREARAEGIREGVELAKEHAEVSEHDGWHKHNPIIDWQFVDTELERIREGEEKKSDD